MFITLTDRDGSKVAVDPSTIRTIKPTQWLDDSQAPGTPESFPWGTMLLPKRDSHDVYLVRETFDVVMQIIADAKS